MRFPLKLGGGKSTHPAARSRCPQASAQVSPEPRPLCPLAAAGRHAAPAPAEDGRPDPHCEKHPNPRARSGAEGSGPREDREPRPLGRSTYLESVGQRKGLESEKAKVHHSPAGFAVVLT